MPYLLTGFAIAGLIILFAGVFTVSQQEAKIIQRFGKFHKVAMPGLNFKVPIIDTIAGKVNLRVQQLDVPVETKTHDNVFVRVTVSVQYAVEQTKIDQAFYSLSDVHSQMSAYVFDVVRARVPTLNLDDTFEKKDDIAGAIKTELTDEMNNFGFRIIRTLVTDIDPDHKVKEAMNEINAAQRFRVAATEKGEAERILKVKLAMAEAESKALQGKGIADQRKAIVEGLRESVDEFQRSIPGATPQDVMNLVLMTQYFDTLKEIGASSATNTILIPHSPGNLTDLSAQLRNAMIVADQVGHPQPHQGHERYHHHA
ncbi:band 7 protein [Isosphaera pallida ATCC 43644]|uniref:Band 7 protein n=1 Tax=Isosphaera pallida (strain ATCC 43644 / DSM 9630 / IS1B) TaxID=575540 RepID=E8R2R8_ISOPI|nr:SPFH domain-containing protein [Isosphaera pallida]ADV63565.1 band 7 protein [Isosphaera pallida ATCC 43644]